MREIRTARDDLRQVDLHNPAAVGAVAHRLAGSSATLGAERLSAAARALEAAARQARAEEAELDVAQRERMLALHRPHPRGAGGRDAGALPGGGRGVIPAAGAGP